MGRSDGENEAPTTSGCEGERQCAPDRDGEHGGLSWPDKARPPASQPATANENATASMDAFDQAAKVGRERGRASPIPMSPAMAILAGRIVASTKL